MAQAVSRGLALGVDSQFVRVGISAAAFDFSSGYLGKTSLFSDQPTDGLLGPKRRRRRAILHLVLVRSYH